MKKLSLLLILLLGLMLVMSACGDKKDTENENKSDEPAQVEQVDQTKPEEVVKAYFGAFEKQDAEGVLAYVEKGLNLKPEDKDALVKTYEAMMASPKLTDLKIVDSKVEGDKATVNLTLKADGQEGPVAATLILIDGKWYVQD